MYHKFELSSIIRTLLAFPRVPYYTYKPLDGPFDAIRLLLLQPAPFRTSPIQCQVIETSWRQEVARDSVGKGYSALSYTWGDTSQKSRIEIDGRYFYVTKNLEQALRHLRLQRTTVRLWADSLCINQDDVEERNLHVSQMRQIYEAALQTHIFLGEATDGSDILLGSIESAAASVSKATTRSAVVRALVKASGVRKLELQKEAFNILWRPYWTRIWIFQEIVVSANPWVQCGSITVPWDTFCQALIALLGFDAKTTYWGSGYSNEPRQRLEDMYWERRAYRLTRGYSESRPSWDMGSGQEFEGRMKLLDLLVTKRGSQATDSRDMVFAVSGIATKPKDWSSMSITYEKSPALVYMDTVKYLLHHHNSYEVLSHAGPVDPLSKIPSWAPDWRKLDRYRTKIIDWVDTTSPTAPDLVQNSHICLVNHSILACKGYQYSTITSISADTSEVKLIAGSTGRVIWSEYNKHHRRKLSEYGIKTRLGTVREMLARSHPLTYRRKVASITGGTLCLVPQEAREDDIIVLFDGSKVPFVLRSWKAKHPQATSWWDSIRIWMRGSSGLAAGREAERKRLDDQIVIALKDKDSRKAASEVVGHYTFVGECYVDGLISRQEGSKGIFVLR